MAALDWSQCPAVESVPGRLNGAWVFRDTRMPVSAVFENLEAGATVEEMVSPDAGTNRNSVGIRRTQPGCANSRRRILCIR